MKNGDAHAIILCNGKEKLDPPFSVEPKVYKNLHGDAVTMVNKFPAMVRCIEAELVEYIEKNMPLHEPLEDAVGDHDTGIGEHDHFPVLFQQALVG